MGGQQHLYSAISKLAGRHKPCGPGEGWGDPAGPTDGLLLTRGSSVGDRRTKTKATAWIGVVGESQKSESSPEDHPAKKWVEDRNHSMKPKQRELRTKNFTSKE